MTPLGRVAVSVQPTPLRWMVATVPTGPEPGSMSKVDGVMVNSVAAAGPSVARASMR